ncbi:HK97 gp10 family phage protein [Bacillus sp. FJAT-45350]|uniref:HK97 gp10 family phage protein n=1 Tax=Bacillus sp. FJAT-45350 TaxID=2011014 RepID=UPI000BB8D30A|nr:HK97 gp10 family phage protein [Bacillus sp. FJAT-45350]
MSLEIKNLDKFEKMLVEKATKELPRETKQIMRKMGSKARTLTARNARSKVKKVTGSYHKSWKRGKLFFDGDKFVIRVYSGSRKAHLIEKGHRIVRNGREVGFVKGKNVLEESMKEFEDREMDQMLSDWLDNLLESGKL